MGINGLSLLAGIVGAALAIRPKRHRGVGGFLFGNRGGGFLRGGTIATVATAAWGVNELLKSRGSRTMTSAPEIPRAPVTPGTVVVPSGAPRPTEPREPERELAPDMLRLVRLTIAAAVCDGRLSGPERQRLMADARAASIEGLVQRELDRPVSIAEIVRGVQEPTHKRDLYTLAFCVVRADEGVSDAERRWLDGLAALLSLDADGVATIERETAERIDRGAGA